MAGCPFGEGCHFLHYVPGGLQAVAQMTKLGNPSLAPDPAYVRTGKTSACNKYNTAEGCKYGEKCWYAHNKQELGKPMQTSVDGPTAPPSGGRLGGRYEPATPAGVGVAVSFEASATAKFSVDASLVCGIYSQHICCLTGAKLFICKHESDPNLKNVVLEGSFNQIQQAVTKVREFIANERSKYKTKLCEYFARGTCAFGDQCHFAHGESELRNAAA